MTNSLSDHGWEIVTSFAQGHQRREAPKETASSADIEHHVDETLDQKLAARLSQPAENLSGVEVVEPEEETNA